ncbi:MAG: hypothetical protein WKG00_27940 [Polyangiaceae bacterium]
MPAVPAPLPPLPRTPTFRFSGKTTEVVMPGGRVANRQDVPSIVRWTSLKLAVHVERYPFEWAEDREPRVPAARALVATLGRAAPWTFAHTSMKATAWGGTAVSAKPFSKRDFEAFTRKVTLQRFNANVPAPCMVVRTGKELDVQYEWSLEVSDLTLTLYAWDTPKNRVKMEKIFDVVRRARVGAVFASLGFGYAGAQSTLLAGVRYQWGPASAFYRHEQKQLCPPWHRHIGRLWVDIPAAAAKAAAFAKTRGKHAHVDDHGLEMLAPAPRSATDRPAALTGAARKFSSIQNALSKIVSAALHDRKQRQEILGQKRRGHGPVTRAPGTRSR